MGCSEEEKWLRCADHGVFCGFGIENLMSSQLESLPPPLSSPRLSDDLDYTDDLHDLLGGDFPESSQGPSFSTSQILPTSQPYSELDEAEIAAEGHNLEHLSVNDSMRDLCRANAAVAMDIVSKYSRRAVVSGWCRISLMKPTKRNGYVQVSSGGANKFAVLQELVVWASGSHVGTGEEASHLCHQPLCLCLDHIVPEPRIVNQGRKNCLVWVPCHHCAKTIFVCPHSPACIKYCEGFDSQEHFLREGVCRILNNST